MTSVQEEETRESWPTSTRQKKLLRFTQHTTCEVGLRFPESFECAPPVIRPHDVGGGPYLLISLNWGLIDVREHNYCPKRRPQESHSDGDPGFRISLSNTVGTPDLPATRSYWHPMPCPAVTCTQTGQPWRPSLISCRSRDQEHSAVCPLTAHVPV